MTPPTVVVTNLRFTPATDASMKAGRLGWLEFDVGPLHVRDVQLRQSASNRLYLSFARFVRVDRRGHEYFSLRPGNDAARLALEGAVISALRIKPEEMSS